jgi:hypothetical protein
MMFKFLLLCIILFNSLAQAAERPKQLKYASREQLRACDDSEARLKSMRSAVDNMIAQYNSQRAQVQASRQALELEQAQINHQDDEQVRAFEEKMAAHNQFVESFNLLAHQTAARSDAYNEESETYNQSCATMVFRIEDRNALNLEKSQLKK